MRTDAEIVQAGARCQGLEMQAIGERKRGLLTIERIDGYGRNRFFHVPIIQVFAGPVHWLMRPCSPLSRAMERGEQHAYTGGHYRRGTSRPDAGSIAGAGRR